MSPSVCLEFAQLSTGGQFATAQEPHAKGSNTRPKRTKLVVIAIGYISTIS
jgi:hypothetical protein